MRASLLAFLVVAACHRASAPAGTSCNGHDELCARAYDAVTFAGTHNAGSNIADDFAAPDQTYGLTRQLDDGIRVLHLEFQAYDDDVYLCHSLCEIGSRLLVDGLTEVADVEPSASPRRRHAAHGVDRRLQRRPRRAHQNGRPPAVAARADRRRRLADAGPAHRPWRPRHRLQRRQDEHGRHDVSVAARSLPLDVGDAVGQRDLRRLRPLRRRSRQQPATASTSSTATWRISSSPTPTTPSGSTTTHS
jgi:hypothetical protein